MQLLYSKCSADGCKVRVVQRLIPRYLFAAKSREKARQDISAFSFVPDQGRLATEWMMKEVGGFRVARAGSIAELLCCLDFFVLLHQGKRT